MTARRPGRWRGNAGLTLVELMITLVVASAVASSTFVFFAGQQRIYETQTKLLNVQQNLWMALEVISRQLRASGTGLAGCQVGTVPPTGAVTPATGLRAWTAATGLRRIPPIWILNGAAGAPDEITFSFFTANSANWTDGTLNATVATTFVGPTLATTDGTPFRANEFIALLDTTTAPAGGDRGCTMFQVTAVAGNNLTLGTTSIWNPPGNVPGLIPFNYVPASSGIRNMGTLTSLRYFIDATGGPNRAPRLMVDDLANPAPAQILADGVEDLQVAYACDTQPGGNPDGSLSEGNDAAARAVDEWTYNATGDVPPPNCGVPSAIRITLLGRSINPDQSLFGTSGSGSTSNSVKAAVEDGVAGAPDAFRHRTLTTTVYPRN